LLEPLDLALRVVILFNLQLPVVKEQRPLLANRGEVYHKSPRLHKGENEKRFYPHFAGGAPFARTGEIMLE
jgi:hypothetical protein